MNVRRHAGPSLVPILRSNFIISTLTVLSMGSAVGASEGSRISEVWQQVSSDPYQVLPDNPVTVWQFFRGFSNLLFDASKRTLSVDDDLLPRFDKLLHPNGICLQGTWNITDPSPYTVYFRQGIQGLIIVRASEALGRNQAGQLRAFGLAGKIYPTTDFQHAEALKTANFFTIEDLGGTNTQHFLDAELTNDIIKISPWLQNFLKIPIGLVAAAAFSGADKSNPLTALIRELYPISELGEGNPAQAVTPIWMKLVGASEVPRFDAQDYRDELRMEQYRDGVRFDIFVASSGTRLGQKDWQRIGFIQLNESVASDSCDHRLHFHHPVSRKKITGLERP